MAFAGEAYFEGLKVTNFTVVNNDTTVGPNIVTGLSNPVEPSDAANKTYVDTTRDELSTKTSCLVATTMNLDAIYNQNEKTLASTSNKILVVDGIAMTKVGARILVKNQTTETENGIYTVVNPGSPTTNFILERSKDADDENSLKPGSFTFIESGLSNRAKGFVFFHSSIDPYIHGIDPIRFGQFSGANFFEKGDGVELVDSRLSVVGTSNRISVTGAGVDIASTYSGQPSITTVGTLTSGSISGLTGIENTPIGQTNPSAGKFTNTTTNNLVVNNNFNFLGDGNFSSLQISSVRYEPQLVSSGQLIDPKICTMNVADPPTNSIISVAIPSSGITTGTVLYFINISLNSGSRYEINFGENKLVGPDIQLPNFYTKAILGPAMSIQTYYNGSKWFLMSSGAVLE
jgi:hypothetical protein